MYLKPTSENKDTVYLTQMICLISCIIQHAGDSDAPDFNSGTTLNTDPNVFNCVVIHDVVRSSVEGLSAKGRVEGSTSRALGPGC